MRSFLTRRTHRAGPAAAMRAPRVGDSDCCTALGPGGVKPGVKSRSLAAPVPTIPLPTHPASSGRGGVPGCGWPPAAPPPPPLPPGGSAPLLPRIGWRGLDGFLRALVSNPSLPRTDTLVAREPVWCPARSAHFFPSLSVAGFVCQAVPQRSNPWPVWLYLRLGWVLLVAFISARGRSSDLSGAAP